MISTNNPPSTREVLTANRTYYVRADGSDSNNGLADSSAGAFLTVQNAINVAAALDSSIFNVTIQASGTTPSTFSLGTGLTAKTMAGGGSITIAGDTVTPSNFVFDCNSAGTVFTSSNVKTTYAVQGFQLKSSAGSSNGLVSKYGSLLNFKNVDFNTGFTEQVIAQYGGIVQAIGNYTISSGASFHYDVADNAVLVAIGVTVTLSSTPAFSSFFISVTENAVARAHANTFSGTATGARYNATNGGVIFTNGAGTTYFPGNVAGTGTNLGTSPYGLYV